MGISILGLLISDFNFIAVALFSKHIPGGYWFLLVGHVLEGLLGGKFVTDLGMHISMLTDGGQD